MLPNYSPWIKQLNRTRGVVPLDTDLKTDVVIVGGGIAGITTAYFTLKNTDKQVVLVEADKVAHGATGHNAGQITSYFERPLSDLVEEFGVSMATEGQRSIESAWTLLEEIYSDAGLQTQYYRFIGYAGFTTLEQVLLNLKNNLYRKQGGLPPESIFISEESGIATEIPAEYTGLYIIMPQAGIMGLLETNNTNYIAAISDQKGCMNSALFCEELLGFMLTKYAERFTMFEGSPVKTVTLESGGGTLQVLDHTLQTERIILCTNGFENFKIINNHGKEIDPEFHHLVNGRIGYMSGYVEQQNNPPTAISYYPKKFESDDGPEGELYFYLTRRPHKQDDESMLDLVCAGGPGKLFPDQAVYSREDSCSEFEQIAIDDFLAESYKNYPKERVEYGFCWHGLMGYTPNGIRRVGVEPLNPALLYNLGCNGVGILPSIYGGKRISRILAGENLEPSIFDPHDQSETHTP